MFGPIVHNMNRGRNPRNPIVDARNFARRTGRNAFVVYTVSVDGHRFAMGWRCVRAEADALRAEVAEHTIGREGSDCAAVIVEAI